MESIKTEIAGIGWVTAAGMGRGRTHRDFAMPLERMPEFRPEDVFKEPFPNLRRMDDYSRLGVTAVALALADAGLDTWACKRNIGIVGTTVYGCLGADVDYYNTVIPNRGAQASPALFSYTSANSYLGEAAIRFGLTGTNYMVFEQHPTGLAGLHAALGHISRQDDDKILGGVCEAGCPRIFGQPDNVPPGAVFFMLEPVGSNPLPGFGILESLSMDKLLFNGSPVDNLVMLVEQCLSVMLR